MIHSDDVSIFIPSRERPMAQRTWGTLPPAWKDRSTVLVNHYEKEHYQLANPHVSISSCSAKGIGPTRQWILEHCRTEWVMMIDDDLYFYQRARPGGIRLVGTDFDDMNEMFRILLEAMDNGYLHGGVTARPTTSFWACRFRVCQRVNNFHFFHVPTFKRYASFTRLPVMEDFDTTLTLLRAGYPNFILFDFCWNQPGSNTAGGCSSYRTERVQRDAAHKLREIHGEVVRVRTKSVRGATSWEGMKERTDVVVQWREAFKGGWHPHWELEKFYNTLKMPKEFWK